MRNEKKSLKLVLQTMISAIIGGGLLVAAGVTGVNASCSTAPQTSSVFEGISQVQITPPAEVSGPLATLTVAYLEGTYSDCMQHNDGDPWVVQVTAWSGVSSRNVLPPTVVRDDPNCNLALTDVVMTNAAGTIPDVVYYSMLPNASIQDQYPSTMLSFVLIASQTTPDFFGNIRLDQANSQTRWDGYFGMDFTYTNQQGTGVTGPITYVQVSGTPVTNGPAAPDYGNATFSSDFLIGVNVNLVVIKLGGEMLLTATNQQAGNWVDAPSGIVKAHVVPFVPGDDTNYDDVLFSYQQAVAANGGSVNAIANGTPASAFPMTVTPEQMGFALSPQQTLTSPMTKWLIVDHHDDSTGLDAFESISVTFTLQTSP